MKHSWILDRSAFLSGVIVWASLSALSAHADGDASRCSETLGLIRKNLRSHMEALSSVSSDDLSSVKEILLRRGNEQEYESCVATCRNSSGAPEKCSRLCENEDAAMNISDAAQRLTSQAKISDLVEVPTENFFASFFMEVPTVETLFWGYEVSITDPFEKHPYAFSLVTRERYVLENAPAKAWTLSRCTLPSFYSCQPELVESDVLEALKRCP